MAFENPTNRTRVLKIVEILDLIAKSAESNRSDLAAVRAMLAPVTMRLDQLTTSPETESAEAPAEAVETVTAHPPCQPIAPREDQPRDTWGDPAHPPRWAQLRDLAQSVPLSELALVVAVYMTRVDAALAGEG
jgi:hypothetical protein